MTSKLDEWKALAKLENKRARQRWGHFIEKRIPNSRNQIAQILSEDAKKINKMLGRGYTKELIAKRLDTTTNRVGQIITAYGLPRN